MVDWKRILRQWSKELMASDLARLVNPPPESPDWLGFEPATEAQVKELEMRLGLLLPPSYKSFLSTSNGWHRTSPFINRVRPTFEVNWFRIENEHWAEVYQESGDDESDGIYYRYPEDGAPGHRLEHMATLVQVSDVDDGVLLLNPQVVTPDGEWEAWFFANWVPGAQRFPSFAHLRLKEYAGFRQTMNVRATATGIPKLAIPSSDLPRIPAERTRRKVPRAPAMEALIQEMESEDADRRDRAIRTFFGKLKGRPRAERRADITARLTELFYRSKYGPVRAGCVAGLTELVEDSDGPKPLLDSLSDRDPDVVLQGIFALSYFPDRRAVEPLCRFVESGANPLFVDSAVTHLGQMGDPAAIPALRKVLLNTATNFDQGIGTAGGALGRCGPRGVDALIEVLDHPDARVRRAAVVGLDISEDPRAVVHLDRMKNDPDSTVRIRATNRTGNPFRLG